MKHLPYIVLLSITVLNVAAAFIIINQPTTEITNYKVQQLPIKQCVQPTDKEIVVEI